MIHPTNDEYGDIIHNIYNRNDNGYNIGYFKYFNNLKYIISDIRIDENNSYLIRKFNIFIKKYIT